jgi:hypothetical protein
VLHKGPRAGISTGRVSCRAAGYSERAPDGPCCCCSGAVLGFELLGITSDLEGLLRRCTTQVAPCGPTQVRPSLSIKSQAEMQARDGPSQLPCVWRPANRMTGDRQSTSGGQHIEGVRLLHGLCRPLVLETPALQGSSCPHRHNQPHGIRLVCVDIGITSPTGRAFACTVQTCAVAVSGSPSGMGPPSPLAQCTSFGVPIRSCCMCVRTYSMYTSGHGCI